MAIEGRSMFRCVLDFLEIILNNVLDFVCVCACLHTCAYVYACVGVCVCSHTCAHVYAHGFLTVCVCMWVWTWLV